MCSRKRLTIVTQVATQPSIWDSEHIEEYKELYVHPNWENLAAFDPGFRWTFREENQVRRKVDWKIMVRFVDSLGIVKTTRVLTPVQGLGLRHVCGSEHRPRQH